MRDDKQEEDIGAAKLYHTQGGSVTMASNKLPLRQGCCVTSIVSKSMILEATPYWLADRMIPELESSCVGLTSGRSCEVSRLVAYLYRASADRQCLTRQIRNRSGHTSVGMVAEWEEFSKDRFRKVDGHMPCFPSQ